ncbi:unnamed protein product [Protopolystoma xenopodis]|uniref:W2 domain-containing protein n=1 Tax=Protopolystoma xenopodis TaxID=117903 RepID=A0A3S4ZNK2_9PLAT|nr:unnamed protein product [Protopolystoma xenopodis]
MSNDKPHIPRESLMTHKERNIAVSKDPDSDEDGICSEHTEDFLIIEIQSTLERSLRRGHSRDNLVLELNSLKHAYNIPIDDLHFLLVKAIISMSLAEAGLPVDLDDSQESFKKAKKDFISAFKRIMESDGLVCSMLSYYLRGSPVAGSDTHVSRDAERLYLQALEDSACHDSLVLDSGLLLIHYLYEAELISEPTIRWWLVNSPLLLDDDVAVKTSNLRTRLEPFIRWLDEAEEDDS